MKHTCQLCKAVLNTSPAGWSTHQKACRKARRWQRNYFLRKGKWPERKAHRSVFLAGSSGSKRAGKDTSNKAYDG